MGQLRVHTMWTKIFAKKRALSSLFTLDPNVNRTYGQQDKNATWQFKHPHNSHHSRPEVLSAPVLLPCIFAFMLLKNALAAAAPPPSTAPSPAASANPASSSGAETLFFFPLCLLFFLEGLVLPLLICLRAKEMRSSHHPRRNPTQKIAAAPTNL